MQSAISVLVTGNVKGCKALQANVDRKKISTHYAAYTGPLCNVLHYSADVAVWSIVDV